MKILSIVLVGFLFIGCSNKIINVDELKFDNTEVKTALLMYKRVKNDKGVQKYAPEELFKATKIAKALVNQKDSKMATYYARLLEKQVKIAELTKKEYELTNKVNEIIIKRNEAIEDAKHQDDVGDSDVDHDTEQLEDNTTNINEDIAGVEELKASFSGDGGDFVVGGKYFDNDDLILNRKLRGLISYIAGYLKSHPEKKVILLSYTDGIGSKAYSIDMAIRRADRFKDELISKGVDENRVEVKPKGAVDFIGSNDTQEGRDLNNRIVINLI